MTTRASHRAGASLKAGRHAKPIGGSVEAKGVVVPAVRLEVEMDDVVAQGFAWAVRIETSSESEQSLIHKLVLPPARFLALPQQIPYTETLLGLW